MRRKRTPFARIVQDVRDATLDLYMNLDHAELLFAQSKLVGLEGIDSQNIPTFLLPPGTPHRAMILDLCRKSP